MGENSKLCEWRIAMQITMDNVCRHEAMTIPHPPSTLRVGCRKELHLGHDGREKHPVGQRDAPWVQR